MEFACYADWDQLPAGVDRLFAQAARDSVFLSRPWFENVVANGVEEGRSMALACVVDGGRVLALLPLIRRDAGHWHSLGHLYTARFSLLLCKDSPPGVLTCLVQGLFQLPLTSLRLDPVAGNDPALERLQRAMESSGCFCRRYFRFYNWIHRLQGQSFTDYMSTRPPNVNNTIARKRRKLAREHEVQIRLYTDADLAQGIADYNAVYKASWKANEQFTGFVEGLAASLSAAGWLRLAVLYIDHSPAAAQFWFVTHGKASIFKLAYDETWKRYSPGSILMHHLFQHVIEIDRVEEIDFLTGNDAYKWDWMSERREHWGLYCAKAREPKGRVRAWLDALRRRLTGRLAWRGPGASVP